MPGGAEEAERAGDARRACYDVIFAKLSSVQNVTFSDRLRLDGKMGTMGHKRESAEYRELNN